MVVLLGRPRQAEHAFLHQVGEVEPAVLHVDALLAARKHVCYLEIDAPQGHDAFLIPNPRYLQAFRGYMNRIAV